MFNYPEAVAFLYRCSLKYRWIQNSECRWVLFFLDLPWPPWEYFLRGLYKPQCQSSPRLLQRGAFKGVLWWVSCSRGKQSFVRDLKSPGNLWSSSAAVAYVHRLWYYLLSHLIADGKIFQKFCFHTKILCRFCFWRGEFRILWKN